ncbi:hypothetical protein AB4138_23780 [Vibrio sp. 10N.286.52.C3]|uniref:hypothetical protein n=1 Tax=Vibrio sp. 10N.286.52.C3 TaxID=3229713 RepID=UPI00354F648E
MLLKQFMIAHYLAVMQNPYPKVILLKQFMIAHYRAVMPNPYQMGNATQCIHDRSLPCSDAKPLSDGACYSSRS